MGYPYLNGLHDKGVYMGYPYPNVCLCAFLGPYSSSNQDAVAQAEAASTGDEGCLEAQF